MSSRMYGSEEALATFACERAPTLENPRVLVGGLGMGYGLRATLDTFLIPKAPNTRAKASGPSPSGRGRREAPGEGLKRHTNEPSPALRATSPRGRGAARFRSPIWRFPFWLLP